MGWTGRRNREWNRPDADKGNYRIQARTKLLTIRVSEEERERISELAARKDLSVAAFLLGLVEDAAKVKRR